MRKESRQVANVQVARVQGYHETTQRTANYENYAFAGYSENRYFSSDRYEKLTADFLRPNGQPLKGYGIEIETECTGIKNQTVLAEVLDKIVFPHFPEGLFKMQRDGSLGGDTSAECITQIMSKAFIRNHYKDFKVMFNDYFTAFGISASRSGRCGMHVNVSRACFGAKPETQTEAVRKLLYVINKHFDFFCALFYRDANNTGYCSRMNHYAIKENAKNAVLNEVGSSHYISLNLGHWETGRVEIRLVGGQKDFACFRNTMESVFFLVQRLQKLSWEDCDDLAKMFKGCNQYVFDRIRSYCAERGTITTDAVEKIRATVVREELI